ncbi:MAG: tyrosine phenol-lyase [Parcubacteria group bacterium GW2011_GWA2_47_10]|nr:MAG: tyrosine phenol-lyase [Parcubacteria group bacterium GW2011_GWA2_47_10]
MELPPFKTKMVEPLTMRTRKEREGLIKKAGYNLFFINSADVMIDFLTDSGTGAMSENQWAALMQGDESYAGSSSFIRFKKAVQKVLGFPFVIPTHQGRGAESVFNTVLLNDGDSVTGNSPFDTTRAHIENRGSKIIDVTSGEAFSKKSLHGFKGNVNLKKLERVLIKNKTIRYVLLTITCNSVGGQPVSLENIRGVAKIAKKCSVPLFYDIARFAENSFFIKEREKRYRNWPISKIVLETMRHADGVLMSATKERDMETVAKGLYEGIEESYLRHRIEQARYLGESLHKAGVPVLRPIGGHAVYVNASEFLPHISWDRFPAHALAISLYIEGGIRGVEIGSLMEGRNPETGENRKARFELLRLAIPRRVYSREHFDYTIDVFKKIVKDKGRIKGMKFNYESPILRHFSSTFKLLS